jgi:hypothetical protein
MDEQFIICPSCDHKFPLSESLSNQIKEKLQKEFDEEKQKAIQDKEDEFKEKLAQSRIKMEEEAKEKASEEVKVEIKDLQEQLQNKAEQLQSAQERELELLRKQRELEEKERTIDLTIEKQLEAESKKIWSKAEENLEQKYLLRERDYQQTIETLTRQLDQAKKTAEQGSQQSQGEVQELTLEDILKLNFTNDNIESVPTGTRGGDFLQKVYDQSGQHCGTIIWESKRTKAWSDVWVQKLKDDKREAKADIAVILSSVLPKDIKRFGLIDREVWVTDLQSLVGLVTALRAQLLEVAKARNAHVGKTQKMELLYNYLSGQEFKHRVEAIVETFVHLTDELNAEKRAMEKIWAKREKQISKVIQQTAGMYGDLQAIIGASLPELNILELPSGDAEESKEENLPF